MLLGKKNTHPKLKQAEKQPSPSKSQTGLLEFPISKFKRKAFKETSFWSFFFKSYAKTKALFNSAV